ncbi:MAG: hypothetical protein KA314_06070 [Chloroflexi bacterium]|nr:hypothetical protein [Chloroflexota bacterium]MBP8055388.1 hypothetical protein [Chloroflexota bacterium]
MLTKEKTPALPTVLETVKAGLELTSQHLWLIVIPVLLDGFYWLGPRLSIRPLMEAFMGILIQQAAATGQPLSTLDTFRETWDQLTLTVNLFTNISLPLIGVPTLMNGPTPEATPIQPSTMEISNVLIISLLLLLFMAMGLLLSVIYYGLVAQAVNQEPIHLSWFWRTLPKLLVKLTGQILFVGALSLIILFPLFCVSLFTSLFSLNLTMFLWFVGAMPLMALILYGYFGPHGVFLNSRPVLTALRESILLVQMHLFSALGLFLLVYLLGNGLTILWQIADDGSWLTVVSIVGHGFVSTSLAAATFIFYRDRYPTLQAVPPEK